MRRAGFTLLEMVVSLTVALMVLGGVYQIFRAAHESVERVRGLDERLQSMRQAFRTLRRDLAMLHLLPTPGSQGGFSMALGGGGSSASLPQVTFLAEDYQDLTAGVDLDTLRFTTSSNDPRFLQFPSMPLVEVYYYVDTDPNTPQEGLVRQVNYWPNLLPEELQVEESQLPRSVVAPEVRGMNLRFLDEQSNTEEGGEWLETWEYPDRVPAAIEVTLLFALQTDPRTGQVTQWMALPEVIPLLRRRVIQPPLLPPQEEAGMVVGAQPPTGETAAPRAGEAGTPSVPSGGGGVPNLPSGGGGP